MAGKTNIATRILLLVFGSFCKSNFLPFFILKNMNICYIEILQNMFEDIYKQKNVRNLSRKDLNENNNKKVKDVEL